ncbi:hypothetical protein AK88_01994 [Plasmodium fragile]|uniref:Sporozoite-specific protein S10 n=1 Tax=Plasmodium fragile TaxID=5857 RepID=A0A0D9QN76_PLAFR|nr:uncharacterized protein AK88_01994 [Plasmodium fragile]KJP88378.1 hypothetical protein AK88_01994 [Plasmodium fragile]
MKTFPVVLLLVVSLALRHLYNYGMLKCEKWDVRNLCERARWRMLSAQDGDNFLPSSNSADGRNDERGVHEQISRGVPREQVELIDQDTGEMMLVDVQEVGRNDSEHVTDGRPSFRATNVRDVPIDQETGEMLQEDGGAVEPTASSSMGEKTVEGGSDGKDLVRHKEEEDEEKEGDSKRSISGNAEAGLKSILSETKTPIKDNESNLLRSIINQINYVQVIGQLLHVADEGNRQSLARSIPSKEQRERQKERQNAAPGDDILWANIPNGEKKGEVPNGTKNDGMIKGYANVLLNEGKNVLKANVRTFLSRVFNLIVREKVMTRMCQRGGEQQEKGDKWKGEKCAKSSSGDCNGGKAPVPGAPADPPVDRKTNPPVDRKTNPTVDRKADPANCRLPKPSGTKFYQSEDLYHYYNSLEEMLKSRSIRWETDRVSRYFTFYPIKKIKDNLEEVMDNKIFIESVRSILFDSHEKNEKTVYSSFAVVIETLFSLIKEEKVIADMYSYVNLFFEDLDILNLKVLNFLRNSSNENYNFLGPPDLSLNNLEYILAKIYSRSVLANILSTKMNHSDSKNFSKILMSRNNDLRFTFLEKVEIVQSVIPSEGASSAMVLRNEGGQVDVPMPVADDTLCKFIPIRKKLLYEKLSLTRKVAEEVILDYLFRLLLRKVHEYVME